MSSGRGGPWLVYLSFIRSVKEHQSLHHHSLYPTYKAYERTAGAGSDQPSSNCREVLTGKGKFDRLPYSNIRSYERIRVLFRERSTDTD